MAIPIHEIVQHLRGAALGHEDAALTDGQLLVRFIEHSDQAAAAALVRRHGPMVWGVCRRILDNHHDAEDAFQATFLVLVRKARSIRAREAVGNWLFGVAQQTARKARAILCKRRTRESQVLDGADPQAAEPSAWRDVQAALDLELSHLPDRYRAAIVLCDLEGKSYREAARQLRCPEGTLAARLARGRAMLARRLAARGLAIAGGAVAAAWVRQAAFATVPASTLAFTIKAIGHFAVPGAADGVVSAKVAALTEGVLKTMLLKKLRFAAVLLLAAIAGLAACGLVYRTQAADPPANSAGQPALNVGEEPRRDKPDKPEPGVPVKTGHDVVSAFEHNKARVDEEYLNKTIRVSGKMYRVDRVGVSGILGGLPFLKETDEQRYFLTMAADPKDDDKPKGPAPLGPEIPLAFVFPLSARKQLAELERGQAVTIEGLCEGKKGPLDQPMGRYVIFTSCKIVKGK